MPDIEPDIKPDIDISVHADIGIPDIDPDIDPDIGYMIAEMSRYQVIPSGHHIGTLGSDIGKHPISRFGTSKISRYPEIPDIRCPDIGKNTRYRDCQESRCGGRPGGSP